MIDVKIDRYGRVREIRPIHIPWPEVACALLLLALAVGAAMWLGRLSDSVQTYRPAVDTRLPAGTPTQPLSQQLVMIVVEGLRDDVSYRMPFLSGLRERSAWTRTTVAAPSLPQVSWTTLLSGATPELSAAPLMPVAPDRLQPIATDHLFARAKDSGLATGLATSSPALGQLIPPQSRDVTFLAHASTAAERDQQTARAAVGFLKNYSADFLVVDFEQVDEAGRRYGASNSEYEDVAGRVDTLVKEVVEAVDLQKAMVIVTSDHGHLENGGYGGQETAVVNVPFVMAGRQVIPGSYASIPQADVAPTVAAILGIPIPSMSEGQVRFEMLDMARDLKVEKALAVGQQRLALGEAVLGHVGSGGTADLLREESASLGVVRTSMELGNLDSAFKLAVPTIKRIDIAVQTARLDKIIDEQNTRWPQALLVALLPLAAWWWRRSVRTLYLTLAAIFAFTFPLGQGQVWSLVSGVATTATGTIYQIAIATGVGLVVVLAYLWWQHERRAGQLMSVILLAALALAAYYGLFSAPGGTHTPSAVRSLGAYMGELTGRVALALGLGGAIVIAGLWWEEETRPRSIVRASYGFVFLLAYGLLQALALAYWRNGPAVSWYLPDWNWLFLQGTTLFELAAVAGLGLLLPLFTIGSLELMNLANRKLLPRVVWQLRGKTP